MKKPIMQRMQCIGCFEFVEFPHETFVKGGIVKCKKCGTTTVFKPHPNAKLPNSKKPRFKHSCDSNETDK